MAKEILNVKNRDEFRKWLELNHAIERECYVILKRGKPQNDDKFYYIDAVEEALCFGWIDNTLTKINGISVQRFAPRVKNSNWTELNKERVKRLETLGLMTDSGKLACTFEEFVIDPVIEKEIKDSGVYDIFKSFPSLYQRIRLYNLAFTKKTHPKEYSKSFNHFVEETNEGKMYGEWNDYGRLLDY